MYRINVCFAADENYAQHMGIVILSVLKNANANDELHFYILDNQISNESKQKIEELKKIKDFSIEYTKINLEDFKNCPLPTEYISIATYFRFIIPTLFPNLDKLIYLDCDMIVTKSLRELFETDISNYYIGGVEDVGFAHYRRVTKAYDLYFYINAGMILINNAKWREDNIQEKLFTYVKENINNLTHADQDVINAVTHLKSKMLNFKWNVQDSFFRDADSDNSPFRNLIIEASRNPAIIHFTGPNKPWNLECTHSKSSLYVKYLLLSPWAETFDINNYLNSLYLREIKTRLNKNYSYTEALKTVISFKGDKYGRVIDCKVAEPSGNNDFDQKIINALNTGEPYFEVLPQEVDKAVNQEFADITFTFAYNSK